MHDICKERDRLSEFVLASAIIDQEDDSKCFEYLRMSKAQFEFLLSVVEPIITRKDTYWRKAICASDRLILTLRYHPVQL